GQTAPLGRQTAVTPPENPPCTNAQDTRKRTVKNADKSKTPASTQAPGQSQEGRGHMKTQSKQCCTAGQMQENGV
ncbi:hypothetical protein, partial [Phyllobacterium myrsinacearum]|uniref:hypothetical protein n=1 Tax=Phyllobacterium myrsinacearum TaxID=28101 RepID=UPI001A91F71C